MTHVPNSWQSLIYTVVYVCYIVSSVVRLGLTASTIDGSSDSCRDHLEAEACSRTTATERSQQLTGASEAPPRASEEKVIVGRPLSTTKTGTMTSTTPLHLPGLVSLHLERHLVLHRPEEAFATHLNRSGHSR